jgi:hypothetical protein
MPRTYRVPYTGTLTNAGGNTDLLLALPADDKPIRLKGWIFGQTSEEGDAAEEAVRITMQRFTATVTNGSGGSAVTPTKTDETDPAAGFTARCNDTTVATTSGTATLKEEIGWNIRNSPWERIIDEPDRPVARQGEALIVRLEDTPADDITGCLTFLVEEL